MSQIRMPGWRQCLLPLMLCCLIVCGNIAPASGVTESRTQALARLQRHMDRQEWDALLARSRTSEIKRYELALFTAALAQDGWRLTRERREILRGLAAASSHLSRPPVPLFAQVMRLASRDPKLRPLLRLDSRSAHRRRHENGHVSWVFAPLTDAFFRTAARLGVVSPAQTSAQTPADPAERAELAPPYQRYVDQRDWTRYYAAFQVIDDYALVACVALIEGGGAVVPEELRSVLAELAGPRYRLSQPAFTRLMDSVCEVPELAPLLVVKQEYLRGYHHDTSPVPLLDPGAGSLKQLCRELGLLP